MSSQVDRVGTFRFDRVNSVGLTTGKEAPDGKFTSITFSALLHLSEFWDAETSEWVDWADADVEFTAFLTLNFFNKKTEKQDEFAFRKKVMEVFDWDGSSYKALCGGDYSSTTGQIRLEDDTYDKAKFPFKAAWLDIYDATPGRQLTQINGDDLDKLTKLMASDNQKSAKPAKAATVKKTAKKTSKKPSAKPPKPSETATVVGKCTDQEAYTECFALSGSEGGDELEKALNIVWSEEVAKVNVAWPT